MTGVESHDSKVLTYRSSKLAGLHSKHLTRNFSFFFTSWTLLYFGMRCWVSLSLLLQYTKLFTNSSICNGLFHLVFHG